MTDETPPTHDVTAPVRDRGPESPGLHCSFCGKHQDGVYKLIAGPGVYICSECIALCAEVLSGDPPAGGVFRVSCQGPDGVQSLEYGPLPPRLSNRPWLDRCQACGTWNVGEGLSTCLHCGVEFRSQERVGG